MELICLEWRWAALLGGESPWDDPTTEPIDLRAGSMMSQLNLCRKKWRLPLNPPQICALIDTIWSSYKIILPCWWNTQTKTRGSNSKSWIPTCQFVNSVRPIFRIRHVALLWALPDPQKICTDNLLAIGSDWELSPPVSKQSESHEDPRI